MEIKSIMFQNMFCSRSTKNFSISIPNELFKTIQSVDISVLRIKRRQANIKLAFHKVRMCKEGKKLALNDSHSSNQTVETN